MPKHTNPFNRPFSPSLALAISPSDVIDFHRSTFGDLRMEDNGGDGGDDKDKGGDEPKNEPDKGKDEGGDPSKLGDAGKRALDAERDAREKAEKETKALREQVDGFFGGLKTLLGGESEKGSKPEELIEQLTSKLDGLERANLVESVARRHKITDEDDLDMLRSAKDEEAMTKLAKRLAPSEETDDKGKGGRTPRADRSQGKGGDGSGNRATSVSQVVADRRAAREAKSAK